MLPETLARLVKHGSPEELVEAVCGLSEVERAALAETAVVLHRGLRQHEFVGYTHEPAELMAELALLAVCPATRVLGVAGFTPEGYALRILEDRCPPWLDEWVEARMESDWPGIDWEDLRCWIKTGVCRKPTGEGYLRLMVHGLSRQVVQRQNDLRRNLLRDRGLLEDEIWRLFSVETMAFRNAGWGEALAGLARSGHIARARLIDACLGGLASGFKSSQLSGYLKLYQRLAVDPGEVAEREGVFLGLLSRPEGRVVTLALKALRALQRVGRLTDEDFLDSVGPVLCLPTSGPVKAALTILRQLIRGAPGLRGQGAAVLAAALRHPQRQIRDAARKLLGMWGGALTVEEANSDGAANFDVGAELDALRRRIADLPAATRRYYGLDAAPGDRLELANDLPVLNGLAEVEPIITHEQLFDAVAQAVDGIHSAMELERIVDGISRFADRRPTGLPRRTRTLVRRMLSRSQKGLGTWATPRSMVQLVHLWLTGTRCEMRCQPPTGPDRSIDLRLAELSARVEHGVAGPLLATPTHEYGWLAPRRLVERMHQLHELGLHPPQLDLIQGLLRLAPDGREEALSATADLPGKAGVVVRWALGGQEAPSTEWAGAWLAAGRGRTPRGVIEPLVLTGLSDEVPDGITPARYRWVAHGEKRTGQQRIRLSISPSDRSGLDEAAFPIQALHAGISQRRRPTVFMPGFMRQWRASIWPGNPDPHLAGLIQRLMGRIDCNATSLEPSRSYLEPLFQPDRNWSALGLLVLGIAMVGKDTDLRGVAVEALHGAVVDGRAQPRQLSGTLLQLMGGGWVKLNRLADALRRLSDISALTSWFSVCILDALIVSGDELPRDAHHLLELWLELLGKLGLLPSQQAQDKLRRLRGSSKTAQLGRAILAQSEASDARGRARVELEFLAGRLERTGRCSGSY